MLQQSPIEKAVSAVLNGTSEQANDTAVALQTLKIARAEGKSIAEAAYDALLSIAQAGGSAAEIQGSAARMRRAVTAEWRVIAGFPRVKVKGSKETGAPDWSTPSVYAGLLADCMAYSTQHAGVYTEHAARLMAEKPGSRHLCEISGLPMSKSFAQALRDSIRESMSRVSTLAAFDQFDQAQALADQAVADSAMAEAAKATSAAPVVA